MEQKEVEAKGYKVKVFLIYLLRQKKNRNGKELRARIGSILIQLIMENYMRKIES